MHTDDIKTAAKACANNEEVIFVSTPQNRWKIFLFWVYQLRYKTYKSFKTIEYRGKKGILYVMLLIASKLSCGYYKLELRE